MGRSHLYAIVSCGKHAKYHTGSVHVTAAERIFMVNILGPYICVYTIVWGVAKGALGVHDIHRSTQLSTLGPYIYICIIWGVSTGDLAGFICIYGYICMCVYTARFVISTT